MLKKMICICGVEDVVDPKTWSGTPYNLYKALQKKGINTLPVNYSIGKYSIYNVVSYLFSKIIFLRRGTRDFFTSKKFEDKLIDFCETNKLDNGTVFLHISDYCVPRSIEKEITNTAYIDATLKGLMQFKAFDKLKVPFVTNFFFEKTDEYLARLKLIFTMNEWSRLSLINDYNIDAKKIVNVGFGINIDPYYGLKDYNNKEILIVLRRGHEILKGLNLLIDAFAEVRKNHPEAKLHVVGTTSIDADGITYYENQPRSVTIELFKRASLYVMPALYEPNGITYLEALSNKVPIIGLDRFAFPEFCNYGEFGFIVKKEDAHHVAEKIIFALNNPNLLQKMGLSGQESTIRKYSWDRVATLMIDRL